MNAATIILDQPAASEPGRIAVTDMARTWCYGELVERSNRAGGALLRAGCTPGDRVLLALPDSGDFVAAFCGALKAGLVPVLADPAAAGEDCRQYVADHRPRIAVVHKPVATHLAGLPVAATLRVFVAGDSEHAAPSNWHAMLAAASPTLTAHASAPEDPAFVLHTSGSTGSRKGVLHAHRSIAWATECVGRQTFGFSPSDRLLCTSRLSFSFGLGFGLFLPLAAGASTIVGVTAHGLQGLVAAIGRERPTVLCGVPTVLASLLRASRTLLTVDLSSLRYVVAAGEPLPEWVFDEYRERFGLEVLDGLGATELVSHVTSNRPGAARPGTCGPAVPGVELRLVDDGKDVAEGKIGALWVRTPSAFVEYVNKPEATACTRAGEWVITGDRLSRDRDGFYTYRGRSDDMIKIAGLWVIPSEIESVLRESPLVSEAFVTARQDESGQRRVVAYVVVEVSDARTQAMVWQQCAGLPNHMIPSAIVCLQELPRLTNGKISRSRLPVPLWQSPAAAPATSPPH